MSKIYFEYINKKHELPIKFSLRTYIQQIFSSFSTFLFYAYGFTIFVNITRCTMSEFHCAEKEEIQYDAINDNTLQICLNIMFSLPEITDLIINSANKNNDIINILLKIYKNNKFVLDNASFDKIRTIAVQNKHEQAYFSSSFVFTEIFLYLFELCFSGEKAERKSYDYKKRYFLLQVIAKYHSKDLYDKPSTYEDYGELKRVYFAYEKLKIDMISLTSLNKDLYSPYKIAIFPIFLFVKIYEKHFESLIDKIDENQDEGFMSNLKGQKYQFIGIVMENRDDKNTFYFEKGK